MGQKYTLTITTDDVRELRGIMNAGRSATEALDDLREGFPNLDLVAVPTKPTEDTAETPAKTKTRGNGAAKPARGRKAKPVVDIEDDEDEETVDEDEAEEDETEDETEDEVEDEPAVLTPAEQWGAARAKLKTLYDKHSKKHAAKFKTLLTKYKVSSAAQVPKEKGAQLYKDALKLEKELG